MQPLQTQRSTPSPVFVVCIDSFLVSFIFDLWAEFFLYKNADFPGGIEEFTFPSVFSRYVSISFIRMYF